MKVFKDYAYYYNAFYHDKDYKAEAIQLDCLLKKYGQNVITILNFGCGTGKHDIELVKMGYQCSGVDASPLMVDIAKRNTEAERIRAEFDVADIREYKSNKKYDAVVSLFHVMSYQNSNRDIIAAFQSAREALNQGGLFVFDVWYGPGVLSDQPCVRVKEVQDKENRLIRIARPIMHDKKNVVDVCYDVFVMEHSTEKASVINEVHSMRYFFRPELEVLLDRAGFELIDNLDCKTLEETNYDSWTSYFIARAV